MVKLGENSTQLTEQWVLKIRKVGQYVKYTGLKHLRMTLALVLLSC